ncbi:MAG: hypothetical protein A3H93_08690 [Rhodocyclales bacterium RIFCSPLOWO2_02_FULL_63_24]|nr:MAG: hypothetical protein A3H93_08690 [Rhodocyclales bacterium RIFCSPLOWO2_02_FULL_63_24]
MSDAWNALREQIEYFSQPFPEAAIAFADAHREEVTPHLVEAIARLADHPEEGGNPDYVLHLYAMHLLATWRETAAYAPLVRLGHHSGEVVDRLLGGTVTESYGRCLASVCDGDLGLLQGLVEDEAASYWARNAALDAIMTRVLEGDASREELVAYLMRLGDAEAARLRAGIGARDEPQILDAVISVATDIGAAEMLDRIRGWFADHLNDPFIIGMENVERSICRPPETCRDEMLGRDNGYVHSVKKEIGWWAGFAEDKPARANPFPAVVPVRHGVKIGRNDPCPCGSGKKYKKCHGA